MKHDTPENKAIADAGTILRIQTPGNYTDIELADGTRCPIGPLTISYPVNIQLILECK